MAQIRSYLLKRPIVSFLGFALLAFFITWVTGLPVVLSTHGDLVGINARHPVAHPLPIPFPLVVLLLVIGDYGPALAAVIVTAIESGRSGVRDLRQQFRRWRVSWAWFAAALLIPIMVRPAALAISVLRGGSTPHWFYAPQPLLLSFIAFGPWGEELGWRGYAQPRLQQRFGALRASILVGTAWFLWHFWTSLTPAGASLNDTAHLIANPVWFMLLAESVLMAWLYNSTRGSLPIAWAFHAGINLGNQTVAATADSFHYQIILFCAAALIVILVNGPRTLARSKTEGTLQAVSV